MKSRTLFLALILFPFFSYSQGIDFENYLSWEKILAKAKLENKYIFVDCYATYCGPCILMDKTVFNKQEVGDFFRKHYISLKLQFDTTKEDSEKVKQMFFLAKKFANQYEVKSFPTYLFFNNEGKLVAKEMAAITPYESFIEKAKNVLDPNNQYYTLREQYYAGDTSKSLVLTLVPEAVRLQDWKTANIAHNHYVKFLDTPYTRSQLFTISASISKSSDRGFMLFVKNTKKINQTFGEYGSGAESIVSAVLQKEIRDKYFANPHIKANWKEISRFAKSKAPELADQIVLQVQISQAFILKDYEEFGRLKLNYFDKYASSFDHNKEFFMNNELMEIFLLCNDTSTLRRAAEWSKVTIYRVPGEESPAAMDTYANLLYKAGHVKKAIYWQEKAVSLVKKKNNPDSLIYVVNLEKMRCGDPTWSEKK